MRRKKSIARRIVSFIFFILAIISFIKVFDIYKYQDFNNFTRAEKYPYSSIFVRDRQIKIGEKNSYKIQSDSFNDSIFYETIDVKPQTPYKVTCMVKTENVEKSENNFGGGAQISIEGTTERSKAISGTNDWTKLVLYFDSKNRTQVNIGFRLGGYDNTCKGTAWFTDIKCESGDTDHTNSWNFVCFIFKNLNVDINQTGALENYNFTLDKSEIELVKDDMQRFKKTCEEFSREQNEN